MSLSLPARFRTRNTATAVAAPSSIRLVATRATGPDSSVVVLAADLSGHSMQHAKRHAEIVLGAMVSRFPDLAVDVQLIGGNNLPLFIATAGGLS